MQVKICGLKDKKMMRTALDAGADYVGLVFFEKSPRNVALDVARDLAIMARGQAKVVALVVNPDYALLDEIFREVNPDFLQLHGTESAARCCEIAERYNTPIIKAVGIENLEDVRAADAYESSALILFDAKADPNLTELPGGNGILFDWTLLKGQKEQRNFMLSGGLTPLNVQNAIALTGAAIVDVSSGVEREIGEKDPLLIHQFIEAAKG